MAHKFDPQNIHKLEDPSRLELFNPERTLEVLGLKAGMTVLDVGTGTGFYLPYLSRLVGEEGQVYGIDIEEEMLKMTREKVAQKGLKNVELMRSEENQIPLPDKVVDFVFMAFTFHELEDPKKFLEELKRVAKASGRLAIIDWKKKERDKGPPPDEVFSEEEVVQLLRESGTRVEEALDLGVYCFAVKASFS